MGWFQTRIEIPVHYDLWMQGATTGKITSTLKDGSWMVKMDHPQVKRRLRIPPADQEYCKVK
jgi:hypothetical protein